MKTGPSSQPRRLRRQSAFTLVEALAGLGIMAISILALYGGITYGFAVTKITRENQRATQVMLETFEIVRLYTWEELNKTSPSNYVPNAIHATYDVNVNQTNGAVWYDFDQSTSSGVVYNGTVSIGPAAFLGASYQNQLRLVTITLKWNSSGVECSRNMNTLVAEHGIQNYVSLHP